MKFIDLETWKGRKHYLWFKKYDNPFYNMNKVLDVTNVCAFVQKNKLSFFVTFLYLLNTALNEIEEFRIREVDGKLVIYDVIHPAYTVMTDEGIFENCDNEYNKDFKIFSNSVRDAIEKVKKGTNGNAYNDYTRLDQYYFTCVPWTSYIAATHPMIKDEVSSIPRIGWCKYEEVMGRKQLVITLCVNHAFIDGYPLCMALNKLQDYLDRVEEIIKI